MVDQRLQDYVVQYYNDVRKRQNSITIVLLPAYHYKAKDDTEALEKGIAYTRYLRDRGNPYLLMSISHGNAVGVAEELTLDAEKVQRLWQSGLEGKINPWDFTYLPPKQESSNQSSR
jgi:hypothetical protein